MTSAKENRYSFLPPRSGSTRPERASERRRDAETPRISATCLVVYPNSVLTQPEALFRAGAFFFLPEAAFAGFRSEPSSERLALRAAIKSMI